MIFAKLDVDMWGHEKFVAAGPAAVGYWAAALAYLRQHTSSDGYLAPHILGLLLGLGERDARKLCERLVEVGLFARQDRGYILLRYASKNETREQIETRRAETRARVAAHRNRRGNSVTSDHGNDECNEQSNALQGGAVPGSGSPSGSVSDPGELERGSGTRRIVSATDDGCFGDSVSAWADGVREATGKPCVVPRGGPTNALVEAIVAHCPEVAKRVPWARLKALAWAKQRVARGLTVNPHQFVDWMNSGEPDQSKPGGAGPDVNPYDGPSIRAERERRERDRKQTEANAAPMPVAEVMAAIGGGRKA